MTGGPAMSRPVWFITGAGSGLGEAIARAALQEGHRAVLTARDPRTVEGLAGEFPERAIALDLDVTSRAQIDLAVAKAMEAFGSLDILVNSAGYGLIGSVEEIGPDLYRDQFETNLFGLTEMCRAALPVMRAQRRGRIINISSTGGVVARPGLGYYHASKFAVEGLSEALSQEVDHLGIKVSIIEPGAFRTAWNRRAAFVPDTLRIADYEESCGPTYASMRGVDGHQEGDPAKAAHLIVSLVKTGRLPLRLALGRRAVERLEAKYVQSLGDLRSLAALSSSVDFDV